MSDQERRKPSNQSGQLQIVGNRRAILMFGGRNVTYEGNEKMNIKLICASLLAAGMATSAVAQSSMGTGTTMEPNAVGSDGGVNVQTIQPMTSDPTQTGSTMNGSTGSTMPGGCSGGSDPASSTASGSVQTQGGLSDATPQGQACAQ
ncbi:hypothetical protein [Rhizobium leguminosarum]|uniref:hypothetical protein n=1 Tax=Rhizobium leguminosarum TaxID=384 RepID=UPI0021BBC3F3|nr:hypothetical protein [Rhizobium leguminosarum]